MKNKKTAIIFGVTGQDGSLLAELLLEKDYRVVGQTRSSAKTGYGNLERLGILSRIEMVLISKPDTESIVDLFDSIQPCEVYNLSGQSSIGLSFSLPVETFNSQTIFTIFILEALRQVEKPFKFFNAGSGDCYGDTSNGIASESTAFLPSNPYAVAKVASFWSVANYRESYKIFACTGILFNHESALRPVKFVTRKIISTVVKIYLGADEQLHLGDLSIKRDWGFAPEYVEAMWRMLQQDHPLDLIISSGKSHTLQEFVSLAFKSVGLEWKKYVVIEGVNLRPSDARENHGSPIEAKRVLNWESSYNIGKLVDRLIKDEINYQRANIKT